MSGAIIKAVQLTASGLVVEKRALFKQVLVFASTNNDHIIEFHDRTTAPSNGDPHYHFDTFGKGVFNVPMPEPGVLFDDGIYVVMPATGVTVTVFYEEV
jgi:hypothetical protein